MQVARTVVFQSIPRNSIFIAILGYLFKRGQKLEAEAEARC